MKSSPTEGTESIMDLRQKVMAGGFAAGVAFVTAASAAYACVPFRGAAQVNVTNTGTQQNSGTHVGEGSSTTPLQYCDSGSGVTPGYTNDAEAQANGGNVITVSVSASTGACVSQLPQGLKSVIINNAKTASASPFTLVSNGTLGNVWSIVRTTGCFTSATPNGNITLDTAFSVNSLGAGTKTYTLPSMNRVDGTNAASSVCVGTAGSTGRAIFVPMKIEATI